MTDPHWLELSISQRNSHGPKVVWVIEIRLYSNGYVIRDYYMAIFISYPISIQDTHIRPLGYVCLRLIWGMIWKLSYHNLFIIHFSFWQVYLFDILSRVKGKTAECSKCGDMGFLSQQKKPYHPCDLVIWVVWPGKKAVSPTWPIITPFALHKSAMFLKVMFVSDMQKGHIF